MATWLHGYIACSYLYLCGKDFNYFCTSPLRVKIVHCEFCIYNVTLFIWLLIASAVFKLNQMKYDQLNMDN